MQSVDASKRFLSIVLLYLLLGLVIGLFTFDASAWPGGSQLSGFLVHIAGSLLMTALCVGGAALPGAFRRAASPVRWPEGGWLLVLSVFGAWVGASAGLALLLYVPLFAGFLPPLLRGPELAWQLFSGLYLPVAAVTFAVNLYVVQNYNRQLRQLSVPPTNRRHKAARHVVGTLAVMAGRESKVIDLASLLYLTANRNRTVLHTRSGDFFVSHSLKSLLADLPPAAFIRVHKRHAVQLALVEKMEHFLAGSYQVILADEDRTTLPVGRTFRKELQRRLSLVP